jgi:ribosome-associated protein
MRTTHRQARQADDRVMQIALTLLARTEQQRAELDLPEVLLKALATDARLDGEPRNRHRRRIKSLLRGMDDLDALQEAMRAETTDERRTRELERWRTRLLEGTDDDLQAFVEAHPSAVRTTLRTMIRAARPETPAGLKARKKLYATLKEAWRAPQG